MSTTITIEYPCSRSNNKATSRLDEQFVRTVCAFANSKGGRIVLRAKENESYSDKDVDDITRKFEQKTFDAFGFLTAVKTVSQEKVSGDEEPSELIFNVEAWPRSRQPCTVNYKLYMATESQVKQIDSSETVESVVENIIEKKRKPNGDFVFGSHHRRFALGEAVHLRESKNIQFKCLKDEESNNCNILTRMQGNKLTAYVSAFANGDGGHIYYGIKTLKDRQNVVAGQVVKNQVAITNGVEKIIKKMLWPKDYGEGKTLRGKRWEIFFEPVSGVEDKCNPKFVIVIAVAPSLQLVFTEEPESYYVVEERVERLHYSEWERRLRQHIISDRSPIVDIPQHMRRCKWSSKKAELMHFEKVYELTQLRNQGDVQMFFTHIDQLRQRVDRTSNMEIILQHQEAAYHFRKSDFQEAERRLVENECYIVGQTPDASIYEFRRLYWLSVVRRSKGEIEDSDTLSTEAMQLAEFIPRMLMEAWLLVSKAKKLEIDIARRYDPREPQSCDSLIKQCIDEYYKAIGKADVAEDSKFGMVNLKQRVHISLARIFLGSFQNQGKITRTAGCKDEDLEKAEKMFETVVRWRNCERHSMTLICKCEYYLARCEQEIRNWENSKDPDFFDGARESSAKALKIAKKKDFGRLYSYANEQYAYLDKLDESES